MKYRNAVLWSFVLLCLIMLPQSADALILWQYNSTPNSYGCSGSYSNCNYAVDNNLDTAMTGNIGYYFSNYTKPSNLSGLNVTDQSLYAFKQWSGGGIGNNSIPIACFDYNTTIQFRAIVRDAGDANDYNNMSCLSSSGWIQIGYSEGAVYGNVYEDEVWWALNVTNGWFLFAAYDEEDLSALVFNVTLNNQTNVTAYTNMTSFIKFYTSLPLGSNTITFVNYTGSDYVSRSRIETIENKVGMTNVTAYLLKASLASMVNFIVVNNLGSAIPDALVTIQKFIGSEWVTITQQETDGTGNAGIYLKDTTEYRVIVTAEGYQSSMVILTPTNPPYRITLSRSGIGTYSTDWSWITYMIEPYRGLYANSTEYITLTITDQHSDLALFGLNITYNGSVVFSQEETASPGGGQIFGSVNLTNASAYQNVYATMWFQRMGYSIQTYMKTYVVFSQPGSAYTFSWSMNQLGAQFDPFEKAFVAIIITFVIMVIIALAFPSLPKEGIAYAGLGILAVFTYGGWFNPVWLIVLGFITLGLKVMGGRL